MAAATQATVEEGEGGSEFNPRRLLTMLQTAVSDNGDISLPKYIAALGEIFKLFANTLFAHFEGEGMLLGVDVKRTLLRQLCSGEGRERYSSVQSMLDYETRHQLVERQDSPPSGTVTLLRIHRMMEYICDAMDKYNDPTVQDALLPTEFASIYTRTLGRFHPPLLLVSIQWALPQIIPSRAQLKEAVGVEDFGQWMVSTGQSLRQCYDAIQKVYGDHKLLHLSQGSL